MIFTGSWIVFVVFDVGWGNDTIKVYSASKTENQELSNNEIYPKLFPNKIIKYRVLEQYVIGNIGGSVEEYEECKIFDTENCHRVITEQIEDRCLNDLGGSRLAKRLLGGR